MRTLGPHARLPLDVDLLENVRGVSRLLGPLLLEARLLSDLDLLLAPALELQTNLREDYAKFYNHREGPYYAL